MVNYNILNSIEIDEDELNQALADAIGEGELEQKIGDTSTSFKPGAIIKGKVVEVVGDSVIVDVGFKSEGFVSVGEFEDRSAIDPGDEFEVFLEAVEDDTGMMVLSKRKADRIRGWQRIIETCKEGDKVTGRVTRKIKSGLLVDIGVPVFLPASQVDIRRPGDIGEYVGQTVEAKIIKIDVSRRNIVISRRKMIEEERAEAKSKLLSELEVGQVRKGVVKNIADFGVFVDLDGMDGLLHITDMSWDRISHPSEMVHMDQEIDTMVLNFDKEKEKIALGLKQLSEDPWSRVSEKYPIGSRTNGEVVNLTSYGAFVKLEAGVEGLVHISEMSWTKRINHPSEMLNIGDTVEVVVLDANKDKKEISLGIKQVEANPWELVAQKYPPNTVVEGVVKNLTTYGAFIEIEEGVDGLLHISDMSWTKKITHPNEMLKKGDTVKCVVLEVDKDKMRLSLGMKQLTEDPWLHSIPDHYIPGQIVKGVVTKITNFGVFVELEPGLEGLLHVSEIADHKVEKPDAELKIGDEIEVKILRVDIQDRKIGLSKKRAEWASEGGEAPTEEGGQEKEQLKGGFGNASGNGIFGSLNPVQMPQKDENE
ncbi:MAG: 30S ribosomal protein S1 [Phycisphaerae bacterium]|nr:30S ribosomal protein S1 [Phycisphaerae bacterium]